MIGIQVITHGKMGQGIIDSIEMIIGDTEKVVWNELKRGQDIEKFRDEVSETTNEVLSPDGVLVFVDMFGASPYNTSLLNSKNIDASKYKVITGVNLPLLIEAISGRSSMNLMQLYEHILDSSKDSIMGWEKE